MKFKCSKCNIIKELVAFYFDKRRNKPRTICKKCYSLLSKIYRNDIKEKIKERNRKWREKNRDSILKKAKVYRKKNKKQHKRYREDNKEQIKQYREDNREHLRQLGKQYYQKNKNKRNNYLKNKRKTDITFCLKDNLRGRIRQSLKKNKKKGSAVRDLGCTVEELKIHLESQFTKGMTWNNYGVKGWHVDHIFPLSGFDLTIREEFLAACHYTNLQPLWAKDNLSKGGI